MGHTRAQPLFPHLQYCTRCCVPETQEGIRFDEMGICQACQSSEQKIHINWVEREGQLRKICDDAKAKAGDNYDCIIPISGGKDSANRLAKKSVKMIGDVSWHDHSGIGSVPIGIAVRFKIPLLVWGESLAENSGRATYEDPVHKWDREYHLKQSAKKDADQMVGETLSSRDLYPYIVPSEEEMKSVGVRGIHLGDYIFWDDERQTEFLRDTYGWKETEMENTYKRYKSVEDIMSGMHDFTCYLKRGFSRTTEQASIDVRNGLLTRDEAFALIREHESERPEALDYYLKITDSTEEEFYEAMKKLRLPQMKDVDIPVKQKNHKNEERLVPFPEQLIQKFNKTDSKRKYLDEI